MSDLLELTLQLLYHEDMGNFVELSGKKFGRLTVVKLDELRTSYGMTVWECLCDCGNTTHVRMGNLKTNTSSCGCIRNTQFGLTQHHPFYRRWANMVQRCHNPNNKDYSRYGGRGITVCDRWRNSLKDFINDLGESYFEGATLDRIDNERGYSPDNVRWATALTQGNNHRGNIKITFRGVTRTASEWSRKLGLPNKCVSRRLKLGWSEEEAITTPLVKEMAVRRLGRPSNWPKLNYQTQV